MGRVTTRRRVSHLNAERVVARPETLVVEEPLEIRLGDTVLTITMRTPGADFELAQGFLLTEGIIAHREDLRAARYCCSRSDPAGAADNDGNTLSLELSPGVPVPEAARNFAATSSCGVCGTASMDAVRRTSRFDPAPSAARVTAAALRALPDRLRAAQKVFDATGGLHAAAIFDVGGDADAEPPLLAVREDIGRHNAVDKVIGWAVEQDRLPLNDALLLVSGRASFELVQKAVMAGISIMAAVSAPSSLAVDLADEARLTLVAFLRGDSMNIYTRPERVILNHPQ